MPSKMDENNYVETIFRYADYVRGPIKESEYNMIVLPFTLLRRLECVMEPTRDKVVQLYQEHKDDWGREDIRYSLASGLPFYNITTYRLADLSIDDVMSNMETYINGFSANVREIFSKFDFFNTCRKLQDVTDKPLLYDTCRNFGSKEMMLDPENVDDRTMSNIYEHLLRKYGESIAEGAEAFMTPRDVINLAVNLVMASGEDDLLSSDNGTIREIYDPTAGTGGFITEAMDFLEEFHAKKNMKAPAILVPYGQEIEPSSWATCKTNLLIRKAADRKLDEIDKLNDLSKNIYLGNTLINDQTGPDKRFDLVFSNPPYGMEWRKEEAAVKKEHAELMFNGRFGAGYPKIDDGSLLFLQHVISKMKRAEEGGAKAAIVLSASPLFTGSKDTGTGPSNIRRWILQNDFVDCIVKLPTEIFYRTGIATYLWILSTRKDESRKGMVQLIDASVYKTPMKKNQGNKRYEMSQKQIAEIVRMYVEGSDHGKTVVVPYTDFFTRRMTIRKPLQRIVRITEEGLSALEVKTAFKKLSSDKKANIIGRLSMYIGKDEPWSMPVTVLKELFGEKVKKKEIDIESIADEIRAEMSVHDENVPLEKDKDGKILADPFFEDYEDIPWDMDPEEYMDKNVRPYLPGAWIDYSIKDKGNLADGQSGIVGTEISFNKYFYKYEPPRSSEEIAKEILAAEDGLENMLREVLK